MKFVKIGEQTVPRLVLSCMRIADLSPRALEELIQTALELGISFFDHADIYGGGVSEEHFGKALKAMSVSRESVLLQSKCGIRPGCYDFSKQHILSSVDKSLGRLGVEYLDYLLLHRPDTLMEPEEVAEAFAVLTQSGKVRGFGVSNFNPMQIELLQQAVPERLAINQLQFGAAHTGMIDEGLNVNITNAAAVSMDGSVLEYCRLKHIRIQAWSPFQHGTFAGAFWTEPKYEKLCEALTAWAEERQLTLAAAACAWILRHPAGIQVICGTTSPDHLRAIARASEEEMSREDWYRIYLSAGHELP